MQPTKPRPAAARTAYTERDRAIARLRSKLHRWELEHLRAHVGELAAKVDELESANAALREALDSAESRAEFWHEQAMVELHAAVSDDLVVGITRDGQMGLVARREEAAT